MANSKLDYPCGYKTVLPLVLPDQLLMSAGPVNLSHRVRTAISLQSVPPVGETMYEVSPKKIENKNTNPPLLDDG